MKTLYRTTIQAIVQIKNMNPFTRFQTNRKKNSSFFWPLLAGIILLFSSTTPLFAAPVIRPGSSLETVATGFGFAEGPSADGQGGILFVDINKGGTRDRPGRILRYDTASESLSILVNEAGTNSGNAGTIGIAQLADGTTVLARGDHRALAKLENGTITTLADRWDNKIFNGPNDLTADLLGGVYFTDPNFLKETQVPQAVYYYSPTGNVSQVATGIDGPNGIGISPNGKTLYVATGREEKVYSYAVGDEGSLSQKKIFANTVTDGMTLDFLGNVYLTDIPSKSIRVFDPQGAPVLTIPVPEFPTNLTFADDGQTLYITGHKNLYRVSLNVPEPSTLLLAFLGFGFLGLVRSRAK